jgi:hypothetical protein
MINHAYIPKTNRGPKQLYMGVAGGCSHVVHSGSFTSSPRAVRQNTGSEKREIEGNSYGEKKSRLVASQLRRGPMSSEHQHPVNTRRRAWMEDPLRCRFAGLIYPVITARE